MSYYQRSGFKHLGESKAQFGGGGWHDMVSPFLPTPIRPRVACVKVRDSLFLQIHDLPRESKSLKS
jgi:hypothetical protein